MLYERDYSLGLNGGISQLEDWKRWLNRNYSKFSDTLKKYKNLDKDLPDEF